MPDKCPTANCKVEGQFEMLLDEFRSFRAEITEWKNDSSERLATLESAVKSGITGNGTPSRLAVVERQVDSLESMKDQHIGQSKFQARMTSAAFGLILAVIGVGGGVWNTYHKENIEVQKTMNEQTKQNEEDKQTIFNAIDVINAEAMDAENERTYLAQAIHKNLVVGSSSRAGISDVQTSVNQLSKDVNKQPAKRGWIR